MAASTGEVVCVTGGSGYIGSWLVRLLLERGYTVNATVKNLSYLFSHHAKQLILRQLYCFSIFQFHGDRRLYVIFRVNSLLTDNCVYVIVDDAKETNHLEALEFADSRLRLFQIDLLDYDSIVAAIAGASGVFHLASPCIVYKVADPEKEILGPAIEGTKNVLTAAKELGVERVVVTSSVSAIVPSRSWPADVVKTEDCWTDEEYCKQKELWYPLSKTLAEKAAWEFAKEKGLDVVTVNPGMVMGPVLPPTLGSSMQLFLHLLQGSEEVYEDIIMGFVHVKDVALAHVLVYENKSASGRHICVEAISHFGDLAATVAELYPEYNIPKLPKDTQPGLLRSKDASKKLMDLGLQFISMEQMIKDSVQSLKSKGYIS